MNERVRGLRGFAVGCLLLVLASSGAPLAAQSGPPAANAVESELAAISQALNQLVALAQRQAAGQRLELLMRQVELKRARLAPLDAQLRQAREAKQSAEDQLRQLEVNKEELADGFGNELTSAEQSPEERERMERMIDQMNRHYQRETKAAKERLAQAEQKILEFENDAQAARAEAEHWEAIVDRELGGG